jgi:phage shock protein E
MKEWVTVVIVCGLIAGPGAPLIGAETPNPLIIDVRTEAEWTSGHLDGAILIPVDVIGEKIGAVAKDKSGKIYVYCRTGRRSQMAKETLEKLGYTDVVNLGALEDAAKTLKRTIVK